MTQELGPNQRKWVEELRSGKWRQGKGSLCFKGEHCCLGVACELFATEERSTDDGYVEWNRISATAVPSVVDALGLIDDRGLGENGRCLTSLNDTGSSFDTIANLLESDPANWFTAPK